MKSRQLAFYERNRERLLPKMREWAVLHKKEKSEYDRNYYLLNKEKKNRDPEEARKYAICYRKNHREKLAEYRRNRLKIDTQYRLANVLRSRFNKVVKNKNGISAVRDLGCTISEFESHLQGKFTFGMSWGNYGKWHLDHIKPLSSFDLTDEAQLLKAIHYTNLQPLWAQDNYKKGNKII